MVSNQMQWDITVPLFVVQGEAVAPVVVWIIRMCCSEWDLLLGCLWVMEKKTLFLFSPSWDKSKSWAGGSGGHSWGRCHEGRAMAVWWGWLRFLISGLRAFGFWSAHHCPCPVQNPGTSQFLYGKISVFLFRTVYLLTKWTNTYKCVSFPPVDLVCTLHTFYLKSKVFLQRQLKEIKNGTSWSFISCVPQKVHQFILH